MLLDNGELWLKPYDHIIAYFLLLRNNLYP